MKKTSIAVCYCLHDDHWYLARSAESVASFGKGFSFVSRVAWNGTVGNWRRSAEVAEAAGLEVILGDWEDEQCHRQNALKHLKQLGYSFAMVPDGDEIYEAPLVEALRGIALANLADQVHVHMETYWKSAEYVIRPREQITPVALVNLDATEQVYIRHYQGGRNLVLGPEYGLMHHLSYAGPDERIQRKLATWGHKDEVVPNWFEGVYKAWDADILMRNLHPTHPPAYGFIERIPVPNVLENAPVFEAPAEHAKSSLKRWPTVSVVIPLYNHPEDIRLCLDSLAPLQDLLHEVIVVDNASTDGADNVAEGYSFVTIIRNEQNLGFAKASNQGVEVSTGEVILYLNSDTVVPRSGLVRLIESLMKSSSIAAAGPYTNECGHSQKINPTFQSLATMEIFADRFAATEADDVDAPGDMLVGFCLAVRKSVLDEIGGFDEQFGLGSFEDNDLCYRMRRAGFRLVVSTNAFVYHAGSRTFGALRQNPFRIMAENEKRYRDKWRDDLETGFASHLAGIHGGQIVFDPNRSPEQRAKRIKPLVNQADISLCMIVRNEERVLDDCLKSAAPFFKQIVIVDTGSTDRTIEIAKSHGAEVFEMVWPDSFSEARNESLKHAKGKWLFWMDADDTLPWACGEHLLQCATQAPPEIGGFIVPVQFVEDGPGAGTRVDHVKLFRNVPGVRFEGRIHEQNLGSIREAGLEIVKSQAYVLHSGYDTSDAGQKRKRERDEHLLRLDLAERPGHPFVLFNLGMTAHYTGEHEEAIRWLDQSIASATPGESHLRKAFALKAMSQRRLERGGEAFATLLRGLSEVGEDAELRFQAGIILAEMGRLEEAREQYLSVERDPNDHFNSIDISIYGSKRYYNLAAVCVQMGNYAEARDWFLKAMESNPAFLPAAIELFRTAMDAGDVGTAQRAMAHVQQVAGKSDDWVELAMRYAGTWSGEAGIDHFLQHETAASPTLVSVRLAFVRRLLAQGREYEARPHLEHLVRQGVAEAAFFLGVISTRQGRYDHALHWMEHAQILNPEHAETGQQVKALRVAVAELQASKNTSST